MYKLNYCHFYLLYKSTLYLYTCLLTKIVFAPVEHVGSSRYEFNKFT